MPTKKTSYPFRTRFSHGIIAEVLIPKKQTGKVAIVCSGLPSVPSKRGALQFLVDHGYVVIFPRYRGTWESEGYFLERSPARDISNVIHDLTRKKNIHDLATGKRIPVRVSAIHLFGSSFGGPAILLNSHWPIVKKIIALAPVIDWSKDGRDDPFNVFVRFTQEGFGNAYRTRHKNDWQKLVTTDFYNPIAQTKDIKGKKIFIIHAKDDSIVPHEPLLSFVEKTGAGYYLKPKGGHHLNMTHAFFWKKIQTFLDNK
ncbi:MAG: prolyl oligopeptidase family serine peptidase [Candidatus Moranbacteria bacterium]|nr:prolyl oligopeptidase family serine peptidase [Candidatus Moranbacteria bacterium]